MALVVFALGDGNRLLDFLLRLQRDEVDHAAGRGAAVNGGHRPADHFDAVDVAQAVATQTVEAVAQLRGGGKTAEIEAAADVDAGQAADVRHVLIEDLDVEVMEELAREIHDAVRQVDDLGVDAAAGHRLGGDVAVAAGFFGDVELREGDGVAARFTVAAGVGAAGVWARLNEARARAPTSRLDRRRRVWVMGAWSGGWWSGKRCRRKWVRENRVGVSGPVNGATGVGAVFPRGRDLRPGLKTNFA